MDSLNSEIESLDFSVDSEENEEDNGIDYRLFFSSMREGAAICKAIICNGKILDYKFIAANNSFENVIGISRKDIIGKTMLEAVEGTDFTKISEFDEVVRTGQPRKFKNYFGTSNGFFDVRVFSPKDGYIALLCSDVTEIVSKKNELEENIQKIQGLKLEAEKANEAKSLFLSYMTHEIRSPLNSIMNAAYLLGDCNLNGEGREYLNIIEQSGEHMLEVVDNLLDISKIESGKFSLNRESFDLMENIEKIIKPFKIKAAQKNLQFEFLYEVDYDGNLIGDTLRIKQILVNILDNAFKFTSEGFIQLRVIGNRNEKGKQNLIFSIKDSGIGIPEKVSHELFNLYTQVHSSHISRYGGTGLGLAICKELVKLMRGEIWFESKVGKGTTFFFALELDVDF